MYVKHNIKIILTGFCFSKMSFIFSFFEEIVLYLQGGFLVSSGEAVSPIAGGKIITVYFELLTSFN